jgi:DNA-binding transcriptional LysR family regulator
MSDIDSAQLRRLDMSQLLVFAELMRHRKLTIVAERLGLTQSAISHALKRLRVTFHDQLFLRRPAGVEPTARAFDLERRIAEILRLSSEALDIERSFDPRTEERIIRIGAPDYEVSIFTPPLLELLSREAPRLRVSFRALIRAAALDALADGTLDVALGYFPRLTENFESLPLFEETYTTVMRKGHSLAARRLTLKSYCAAEHRVVSLGGDLNSLTGMVDQTLAQQNLSRRVVATVPMFFPALTTVAASNLVATIPSRLAERHARQFNLVTKPPPLALRTFIVRAVWHKRATSDLTLKWLRGRLGDLAVTSPKAASVVDANARRRRLKPSR